jgi:hypothetical protein
MQYRSRCNIFNSFVNAIHFRYIYKGRLVKISANIAFLFYKEIYMKYVMLYYKLHCSALYRTIICDWLIGYCLTCSDDYFRSSKNHPFGLFCLACSLLIIWIKYTIFFVEILFSEYPSNKHKIRKLETWNKLKPDFDMTLYIGHLYIFLNWNIYHIKQTKRWLKDQHIQRWEGQGV